MAVIKSFISAIGLYSRIPMPSIKYKEKEDRFAIAFFPFIGIICMGVILLLVKFQQVFNISDIVARTIICVIPLFLTGGIHLDGFIDCMDAIHCYEGTDKRHAILKDAHIGAFSIIKLLELCAVWFACIMTINEENIILFALGFVISRALSGIALLSFRPAKETGMASFERKHSSKACKPWLFIWLLAGFITASYLYEFKALIAEAVCVFCFYYYKHCVYRDFDGITGDTEGCFLVMTETAWLVAVAIGGLLL